jgi:RNA polymerase sigma factor (sigma-70 family)
MRSGLKKQGKQAFVADLETQHGRRLRRFLASRLPHRSADAEDLAQEVYLRLLRLANHETIRSSEAYLYTVACHVLHQHVLRRSATPEAVDISTLVDQMECTVHSDPATEAETQQRLASLQQAIRQLSPKARAVLLLNRRDGYSLEEIAGQLGFSRGNAAKYLSKALLHCRRQMDTDE